MTPSTGPSFDALPALRSAVRHTRAGHIQPAMAILRAAHEAGDWHTQAALEAPMALLASGYADLALTVLDGTVRRMEAGR